MRRIEACTRSMKRRVLRQARDAGTIRWDLLDRLLLDACRTPTLLRGLLRSLKGVRVVAAEDPADVLEQPRDGLFQGGDHDGRDQFDGYAERVRSMARLNRTEEHLLARRLEFTRARLEGLVGGLDLSAGAREQVLMRGVLCMTILENGECTQKDAPACAPCNQIGTSVQCACRDYNRVRACFVERNLHLVVGMAVAYRTYGVPLMDLIQEGNASLIRAVEKFDWRKDVRFQTYGAFWVRQAIERLITANRGIVRVPNYIQQKMRRLRREGKLPRSHKEMDVRSVSSLFGTDSRHATRLMETDRSWFSLDAVLGSDDDDASFASSLAAKVAEPGLSAGEKGMLGDRLLGVMRSHLTPQERDILKLRFGLDGSQPCTLDQIGRQMSVSRERIRQIQVKALDKLKRPEPLRALQDFL